MCNADKDCDFPRICCPSGRKRYCLASYTPAEELPVARQLAYRKSLICVREQSNFPVQLFPAVESISQYFQCTAPPPPIFDRNPKSCNNSLSCLPNICCLEGGKKHCRPPKRNILAALTAFTQRFGFIRDFTENLVIRR